MPMSSEFEDKFLDHTSQKYKAKRDSFKMIIAGFMIIGFSVLPDNSATTQYLKGVCSKLRSVWLCFYFTAKKYYF